MPKISVIVPCYNQAQYLDECLQSVENQTFADWECIIINDSSPDNTEEVAQRWTKKDSRFRYIKKENGGLSSARNFGIENAFSEWVLPLDADDKISENYMQLAESEFNNGYSVIYCKAKRFGAKSGLWQLADFSLHTLSKTNMIFCTSFFRKSDWQKVGGFDTKMIYGWEDWDFWISLLKNGGKVLKINKICFFYRIKENSMIKNLITQNEKKNYTLDYLHKKHSDFFNRYNKKIFLVFKSLSLEYQEDKATFELIDELLRQNYEIGIITTKKIENEMKFSEKIKIFYLFNEKDKFLSKIKPVYHRRIRKLYKKELPDTILAVGNRYFYKTKIS